MKSSHFIGHLDTIRNSRISENDIIRDFEDFIHLIINNPDQVSDIKNHDVTIFEDFYLGLLKKYPNITIGSYAGLAVKILGHYKIETMSRLIKNKLIGLNI